MKKKKIEEVVDDDLGIIRSAYPEKNTNEIGSNNITDKNYDATNQDLYFANIFGTGYYRLGETEENSIVDDEYTNALFPKQKDKKKGVYSSLFDNEDNEEIINRRNLSFFKKEKKGQSPTDFFNTNESELVKRNIDILNNIDIPQIVISVKKLILSLENSFLFQQKTEEQKEIIKISIINTLIDKFDIKYKDEIIQSIKKIIDIDTLLKTNINEENKELYNKTYKIPQNLQKKILRNYEIYKDKNINGIKRIKTLIQNHFELTHNNLKRIKHDLSKLSKDDIEYKLLCGDDFNIFIRNSIDLDGKKHKTRKDALDKAGLHNTYNDEHTRNDKVPKIEFDYKDLFEHIQKESLVEAVFNGKNVKLNKVMRGDVSKFKVYVNSGKKTKDGKVKAKKLNFGHGGTSAKKRGEKTMQIQRDDAKRRKAFRSRFKCDSKEAKDKTKKRYWNCYTWGKKSITDIMKEEKLVGGLADNMKIKDLVFHHFKNGEYKEISDKKNRIKKIDDIINYNFDIGIDVEKEHSNEMAKIVEIVKDHLYEDIHYYEKLSKLNL